MGRGVHFAGVQVALVAILAACAAACAAAGAARPAAQPLVRCGDVIAQERSGSSYGSRVVLGVVSVPPARIERGAPTGSGRWTHFSKWGIAIRSGAGARVSVPRAWRNRVAITWGALTPVVSTLRFAPCSLSGHKARPWSTYPGGFYLNTATACVPLIITVRNRSRVVYFGLGESCRR